MRTSVLSSKFKQKPYSKSHTTVHLDKLLWLGKREFSINSLFNNWTKIPLFTQLYVGLITEVGHVVGVTEKRRIYLCGTEITEYSELKQLFAMNPLKDKEL